MTTDVTAWLRRTVMVTVPLFFALMCYYHVAKPAGFGDERLFLTDLDFIRSQGWVAAIEKGIGLTYLLIAYPLTFVFADFVALRLINVILMLIFSWYLYERGYFKNKLFYHYLAFVCSAGFFLAGINDTLFTVSMLIFFIECNNLLQKQVPASPPLMWSALVVAFFTRELFYIYIPIVGLAILLLLKARIKFTQKAYVPAMLLAAMIALNWPSLTTRHRVCYDDKLPPNTVNSTWPQRQYLAQLMVNEGKIPNMSHPSWAETDAYLLEYGANSLPKTTGESIMFDPKLTVIEFFKDFGASVVFSIRQTGLIWMTVFGYFLFALFKRRFDPHLFLPMASFLIVAIFSFIIISFIETRWLLVAYLLSVLYYSQLESERKLPLAFSWFNHATLLLVMVYGVYKVLPKL